MRTREQIRIETGNGSSYEEADDRDNSLIIEVLLDIRDLLDPAKIAEEKRKPK